MEDEKLVRQVLAGNEHAFRILVATYHQPLFKAVYPILRNEKDAEDAVQESFIRIYYALPRYQFQGLKTWMTRIAVNHAIDMKRKAMRQVEAVHEPIQQAGGENLETFVIRKEEHEAIRRKLAELPTNYRDVIQAFYIDEKSCREIASDEEVTIKTVETKLYRARQWMKKNWKEEDFN
ncbi:sigma-70 family RNA polymerase sigma factor [Bacillus tianshenii]|nr:sigma-70 family RNA polymerase sigma factor [Bacillus tianshenii]